MTGGGIGFSLVSSQCSVSEKGGRRNVVRHWLHDGSGYGWPVV